MHHRLAAMMLAASSAGGGVGGTIWDDNFDVGSTIDTGGTRFASAKAWTHDPGASGGVVTGGQLQLTPIVPALPAGPYMGTLPAGDWTFETKCVTASNANFAGGGMFVYELATGKSLCFGVANDFGFKYQIRRFTNATTWAANYNGGAATLGVTVWLDISRSGTNLVFRHSTDGVAWTTLTTVAQTADFTTAPDYVGLWAWKRSGAGIDELVTFDYFHKTA